MVFFLIARFYWSQESERLTQEGIYMCSMYGTMVLATTFGGMVVNLAASVVVQIPFFEWRRRGG